MSVESPIAKLEHEAEAQAAQITLRSDNGAAILIDSGRRLKEGAALWTQVVRNRRRWVDEANLRALQAKECVQQLYELGIDDAQLDRLAVARLVEVSIPFHTEARDWEARIFPWEYVLTAALQLRRQGVPERLTVVRHLVRRRRRTQNIKARQIARALIVRSAAGPVNSKFSFDSEVQLVKNSLLTLDPKILADPGESELTQEAKREPYGIVHLAGVDTHQAVALGILREGNTAIWDGYVVRGEAGEIGYLNAEKLAKALNAGRQAPWLACCNFYNSAARLAALLVAAGAGSAIGFQDEFDDSLGEVFFGTFYLALMLSDWDTLTAFRLALERVGEAASGDRGILGSGIVLWSDHSLLAKSRRPEESRERKTLDEGAVAPLEALRGRRRAVGGSPVAGEAGRHLAATTDAGAHTLLRRAFSLPPAEVAGLMRESRAAKLGPDDLNLEIKPVLQLNYSMLHNDRSLFETFRLTPLKPGRIDVQVTVTLQVGDAEPASYDERRSIQDTWNVSKDVHIPLTFATRRTLAERVHTTLRVKVGARAGEQGWQDCHDRTYRITLLPFDEWRDDDTDRVWLPSFVLPRDPAVGRIVGAARHYLMALADDGNAGFDGYQSAGLEDNPGASHIDLQVQAIWCALLFEQSLSYINPPPTYTDQSQRVRAPGELLVGKHGTCIDLALLLAACLEYVEIYPVIFLLKGHAFAGYWRDHTAWERFCKGGGFDRESAGPPVQTPGATGDRGTPWYFSAKENPGAYESVVQGVREGTIVPLETVGLTRRGGFGRAMAEGHENLRSQQEFEALIDISLARRKGVTPIPARSVP